MPAQRGIMRILRIGMQSNVDYPTKKASHGRNRQEERASETGERQTEKPEHIPAEDDDDEDGDIATPKRDRTGNDDEPL